MDKYTIKSKDKENLIEQNADIGKLVLWLKMSAHRLVSMPEKNCRGLKGHQKFQFLNFIWSYLQFQVSIFSSNILSSITVVVSLNCDPYAHVISFLLFIVSYQSNFLVTPYIHFMTHWEPRCKYS